MFLAARYQFKRAGIDCVRCRLTDCKQATRRAIELAAFAHRIHRHPHLAEVWADASKDDNAYDRYRKKFSGKALFPADHETLQTLSKSYDYCSKHFHGSPFSVGARTTIELGEGGLEFRFREFECSDQDKSEPAATFLWLIDTHLQILDVFAEVFEAQLGDLMRSWRVRATSLRGKLEEHVVKWRDAIVNGAETPEGVVTLITTAGNGP
jgi:hypothetical protein